MRDYDLTQGGIMRKLLLVAVPIMSTQLLQMSYNLTDMFWLGRLSDVPGAAAHASRDAVAASGTAGMFIWLSMAFLLFGRMGAEIGVSQNLGKGSPKEARGFAQNSIILSSLLGLFYGLLCIFGSRLLISFFAIPEENVARDAANYLSIVGFGIPFVFVSFAITGAFNGSGNAKLPFKAHSLGFILNMLLSPLLIFVADMGVIGAAAATVVANVVTFSVLVIAMKRNKGRPFDKFTFFVKPSKKAMHQIFKWSLPISCESLLFTFLTMIITRMVFTAPFGGADAQSVMRVGGQIESLSWLVGGGFGTAMTAFTGQNFGAGKWTRIHKGRQISIVIMCIWGAFITFALFFLGENLFTIFLREPRSLVRLGRIYLQILAFCQISMCLESISSGILRGMGKTLPPSIISIAANVMRVPLAFVLSQTSLELYGIWVGITIGACLRGFGMFAWCQFDARKRPRTDTLPEEFVGNLKICD